jgi:hypothetical protein
MSDHIPLTKEERGAICMAPELTPPSVIIRLLTDLQNAEREHGAVIKAIKGVCFLCLHYGTSDDETPGNETSPCHTCNPMGESENWQLDLNASGGAV